jgi:hypothetical protein
MPLAPPTRSSRFDLRLSALVLSGLVAAALALPLSCVFHTAGIDGPPLDDPPDGGDGICGDGLRAPSEACDGDDLGGQSCASRGYAGGELRCDTSCAFDPSACEAPATCGDGEVDPGEACDGADLAEMSCELLGHFTGALTCSAQCTLDESACLDAPSDWYDVAWAHRRTLTIQRTKVAEELSSLAVLIDLSGDWLSQARPDGADLLFTEANGKTPLPLEIERFAGSPPRLTAWVRVPGLSPSVDTPILLYYGNPSPAAPPSAGPVWEESFAGVWHLGEAFTAGEQGGVHADATGQGRTGTQNGNGVSAGKIGEAQVFDGKGDHIDIAHPEAFVLGDSDCTISAWIKTGSSQPMGILLKSKGLVHEPGDKLFGVNHTSKKLGQDQGWVDYVGGITDIDDDAWHYVVWTQKRNVANQEERWELYVDGGHETGKNATTKDDVAGHTLRIGWHADGSYFDKPFDGSIDELRVSSVTRSPGWIATTFANQSDPGSFTTVGPEQSLPKAP